jgi:hypothetical protein
MTVAGLALLSGEEGTIAYAATSDATNSAPVSGGRRV